MTIKGSDILGAHGSRCEHLCILPGREPKMRAGGLRGQVEVEGTGRSGVSREQLTPGLQRYVSQFSTPSVSRVGGAALIRLDGPLMNDPGWLYDDIECLTHAAVAQVCNSLLADPSVHTVVLDLQCPGWGMDGSSDTIAAIQNLAKSKRTIAYIHDMAASGGLWMASLCEQRVISPTGWMGSAGTLILLYDTTQMVADAGVKPVVIASDPDKAGGAMGVPVSDTQKANLQRIVDQGTQDFFAAISKGMGIPVATIASWKAGMFAARDCVSMKLAGSIESPDAFMARLAAMQPKTDPTTPTTTTDSGTVPAPSPTPAPTNPNDPGPSARARVSITTRKGTTMEFKDLTIADLRANCGQLITEIEKTATETALNAEKAKAAAPASYTQLKEAFGTSEAAFIVDCQEKAMSLADAHKAYATKMREQVTQLTGKLDEAQKASLSGKGKTEGVEPLATGQRGATTASEGAEHPFTAQVKALAGEKKLSIAQAMKTVAKENPKLHAEFIADSAKQMREKAKGRAA